MKVNVTAPSALSDTIVPVQTILLRDASLDSGQKPLVLLHVLTAPLVCSVLITMLLLQNVNHAHMPCSENPLSARRHLKVTTLKMITQAMLNAMKVKSQTNTWKKVDSKLASIALRVMHVREALGT